LLSYWIELLHCYMFCYVMFVFDFVYCSINATIV
jgi:hypothetical protein